MLVYPSEYLQDSDSDSEYFIYPEGQLRKDILVVAQLTSDYQQQGRQVMWVGSWHFTGRQPLFQCSLLLTPTPK